MKRVICISGDAASGKTTAARAVQARLPGWEIVSTGAMFRAYCAERGIDPQEISHLGDDLHRAADARMLEKLTTGEHLIAEARLVGYLARDLSDAVRVFCTCPLEVRAERFRGRELDFDADEARRLVMERDAADVANLRHLYGIDFHDPAYYNLLVDTNALGPDEIADRIIAAANE